MRQAFLNYLWHLAVMRIHWADRVGNAEARRVGVNLLQFVIEEDWGL